MLGIVQLSNFYHEKSKTQEPMFGLFLLTEEERTYIDFFFSYIIYIKENYKMSGY